MTDPTLAATQAARSLQAIGELPPLNPLHVAKARSSLAVLVTTLGAVAPLLPAEWRVVSEGGEGLLAFFDAAAAAITGVIDAVNVLLVLGGTAWLWLERRNPKRRLSFSAV